MWNKSKNECQAKTETRMRSGMWHSRNDKKNLSKCVICKCIFYRNRNHYQQNMHNYSILISILMTTFNFRLNKRNVKNAETKTHQLSRDKST